MITRKLALATMGFAAVAILGNVTAQTDLAPSSGGNARAPRVRTNVATNVPTGSGTSFGDPLPNLTAAEFAEFAGTEVFLPQVGVQCMDDAQLAVSRAAAGLIVH